jgi:hypothetical protein
VRRAAPLLAVLLLARAALAGTEITIETRQAGAPPDAKPRRSVVAVEGRRLHAELIGSDRALLWNGEAGALELLDHGEKRVFAIDRKSALSLSRGIGGVRERVLGGAPAPARVELRVTGKKERVNGVACRLLEALRDGARLAEICEGPRGAAGVPPEALRPARELAAFVAEVGDLLPAAKAEGLDALALVERVEGVPLRVRAWPKGAPASESRIVRAVAKRFGPERFEPPPGYASGIGLHVRE